MFLKHLLHLLLSFLLEFLYLILVIIERVLGLHDRCVDLLARGLDFYSCPLEQILCFLMVLEDAVVLLLFVVVFFFGSFAFFELELGGDLFAVATVAEGDVELVG